MTWARKFAKPIVLRDGRTIVTLADARAFIHSRPERQREERRLYAGALLLDAAIARKRAIGAGAESGGADS
jgi:hypothetical protein